MKHTAEEIKPYNEERPKGEQVEEMFDSIAPAYDFMNTAMTFGLHRKWLGMALKRLTGGKDNISESYDIVDLATGTGDVAFRLGHMYSQSRITGLDLSEGMLKVAEAKLRNDSDKADLHQRIEFRQADCMNLPYPDESFDILTIAYGVRNFESLEKGIEEFYRVLRKGGRCMILELSRPENKIIRLGYDAYSRRIIPFVGKMVSKDSRAYSYLPESIAAMPPRKEIVRMLEKAGFTNVGYKALTMGVVTYYIAEK